MSILTREAENFPNSIYGKQHVIIKRVNAVADTEIKAEGSV